MQEILDEFDREFPDLMQPKHYAQYCTKKVRSFVLKACVEYAKSITPQLRGDVDARLSKLAHDRAHGFDKCIECIYDLIEEDSQCLSTN